MNAVAITLLLWAGKAPHTVSDTSPWDKPNVAVYPVAKDKASGAAVVVCPGGGYGHLAMDHEGRQVAEYFNKLGITAFVLQYRIAKVLKDAKESRPGPLHPAPLEDAQRALRLVRSKAAEYGYDPRKIGLMGFSAGGHLASTSGTHFDAGKKDAADPIERMSCRPDFLILAYPVISMEEGVAHGGSKTNLLGKNPDPKLVEFYSNEKHVTAETPPTFLFHTDADTGVLPENSLRFYQALKKAKVPAELHIFEAGPHGVGILPKTPNAATNAWSERLTDWLVTRELVKK